MKNKLSVLILCLFTGLYHNAGHAQEAVLLDSIVAIVNEAVITRTELDAEIAGVKLQLAERNIPLPPQNILAKQVLERLIVDQLQVQEAARYGIVIDDTMLNDAMRDIASSNNLTLEQLRQKLLAEGIDYIEYRESIRKQITITQINQGYINSRIKISKQEIDDFLSNESFESEKDVRFLVSHIMIAIPEAAKPQTIQDAKTRIDNIHSKLLNGEDFAQLALANSEDQTALDGGSLGWNQLNQLPTLFAKNVAVLKRKEFTNPIRSPGGFHILYLEDKKGDSKHITKQIHARHILITTNAIVSDDDARKKLNDLRKRISKGGKFSDIAKSHSEDAPSAVNGGDLDWADPKIYAQNFRNVIESLPINTISEPFQSQFGWHIVEVLGRRDHDDTDEHRRDKAYKSIYNRKAAEEEQLWLRKIRSTAYIETKLDEE